MALVFVGDIAYPYHEVVNTSTLAKLFNEKVVVGNLEGPIIDDTQSAKAVDPEKYNLYSCNDAINILQSLNVKAVSLANNHFCDYRYGVDQTLSKLNNAGIDYFGLKNKKWLVIRYQEVDYILYGAYTFVTGGNRNKNCVLNSFNAKTVLKDLVDLRKRYPAAYIVTYIHWGYELANYPLPADRDWAREAISIGGTNAVIGHHPHVVQDVEIVNSKGVIAYSLGNFILPQTTYDGKKLTYKDPRVLKEVAIELEGNDNMLKNSRCYAFEYLPTQKNITLTGTTSLADYIKHNPFHNLNSEAYLQFYKREKNIKRYPTYTTYHNSASVLLNHLYIKTLKTARRILIKLGLHKPF